MLKSTYNYFCKQMIHKINTAGNNKINQIVSGLTAYIFQHNYAILLYYTGIFLRKAIHLTRHSDKNLILEIMGHLGRNLIMEVENKKIIL